MRDYIFLMHNDAPARVPADAWAPYLAGLRATGRFEGGSAVGPGVCLRRDEPPPPLTAHIGGYLRVSAEDLEHARALLVGNPVYEAGGSVEIRELPRTE